MTETTKAYYIAWGAFVSADHHFDDFTVRFWCDFQSTGCDLFTELPEQLTGHGEIVGDPCGDGASQRDAVETEPDRCLATQIEQRHNYRFGLHSEAVYKGLVSALTPSSWSQRWKHDSEIPKSAAIFVFGSDDDFAVVITI